ncbi:Alkaline ceramidase 3, partial [Gonapodya sp. JEL0774]
MVIVGLFGLWLHRLPPPFGPAPPPAFKGGMRVAVLEAGYSLAFVALAVVGWGSVAFHATLLRESQILDEVPMVYCGLLLTYCSLTFAHPPLPGAPSSKNPFFAHPTVLPLFLTTLAIGITFLVTVPVGKTAFVIFVAIIVVMEVATVVQTALLARAEYRRIADPKTDPATRSGARAAVEVFWTGLASFLAAVTVWLVDSNLCEYLDALGSWNPQFHAWWHVLASLGVYNAIVYLLFFRQRHLLALESSPHRASVRWLVRVSVPLVGRLQVLPYVVVVEGGEVGKKG